MIISDTFSAYRHTIASLPPILTLTKEELFIDKLLLKRIDPLELYYAPHNDVIFEQARLMIVGLTPGFHQMQIALAEAQAAIQEGDSDEHACLRAKRSARFAGAMRKHLISMLDELKLHEWLGLDSCLTLFEHKVDWLNSTSVIPYPAFLHQKNYTGSQPNLLKHEQLCSYAVNHMKHQLQMLSRMKRQPATMPHIPIIPLGKGVEGILQLLASERVVDEKYVLWGFPHPSGANGHRHKQFLTHRQQMIQQIASWI